MVRLALVLVGRGRLFRIVFSAALSLVAGACIWAFHNVRVDRIETKADSVAVQTPVKAHLRDGTTVLYRAGVVLARDTLRGTGFRYGVTLRDSTAVSLVPLDSVVAMESFRRGTDAATTFIVSTLATGVMAFGAVIAAFVIACSGGNGPCSNCPTVYADSAGTWALQAEGFSYTLGPTFETRDVDLLRIRPDRDGRIQLEVRNEALETDYLNHLELLEIRHDADETALPDPNGAGLTVGELVTPNSMIDAAGRDVRSVLTRADGAAFQTDEQILTSVSSGNWDDAIYLVAPAPAKQDSVALVLRLKNSLLATLLYSDVTLRDVQTRDGIGRDPNAGRAALAHWQGLRMGMRVAVWDGRRYHEAARIRDSGPHAWNDLAVLVPVLQRDSVRVRLSFPADNWRLDQVAFAMRARRPIVHAHAVTQLRDAAGREDTSALASVQHTDRRYLRTSPGERFTIAAEVGVAAAGPTRTFLIATQGYYEPWISHAELTTARAVHAGASFDDDLLNALRRWGAERETRERALANQAAHLVEMRSR